MRIVVLDKATLGEDISLEALQPLGKIEAYDSSTYTEAKSRVRSADAIILNKVKITDEIISSAPSLKIICVTATGYDNIDIASAKRHGVAVCNVPGYSTDSVTLFTIATTLALVTHLREYNKYVTDGSYTKSGVANRLSPVYHEISSMTWGIIGYGNIGRAVGEVAKALGAKLIVNKRTKLENVDCVSLEELCAKADIITIHCPLNEETREIINKDTISLMKNNVIIVNEARGGVVNTKDIVDAIKSGRIGGFGSDVYELEPLAHDSLLCEIMSYDNVLLTPHAAWGAYESRVRCINTVADNISAFIGGKTQNRVDI